MASTFNTKAVHKDGKAELKIGLDENAKVIDGVGKKITFTNLDGSAAEISKQNIPCIPENASAENKLVTQEDLKAMMKNVNDIMESAKGLARILGMDLDDNNK